MRSSKNLVVTGILVALVTASVLGLYQWGKSIAREQAFTQLNELRDGKLGGVESERKVAEIRRTLKDGHGQTLADINITDQQVAVYVAEGWARTALANKTQLFNTNHDSPRAKSLKAEFESAMKKSGRSYAQLGTSEQALAQRVAFNALQEAKQTGARITPALYQQAGLPSNTIVRTRTVTRTVRVPAVQRAVAKKPAVKKAPARRR